MTTLKLNNIEFEITSFNRTTYVQEGEIHSNANFDLKIVGQDTLESLFDVTITSLQIKYNDEVIYTLNDISAHLNSIGEYLNTDHISANLNLTFDM